MTTVSERAYAKINLSLDITGVLENGYHTIESVMQTVSLFDNITVCMDGGISGIKIICSDGSIPTDEKNTCHKAARLFFEKAGISDYGVIINIEKNIPSMAGLGGGSSDAAAVLRILNRIYSINYSAEELRSTAAEVGADVPFLIEGGCALCTGIGENVLSLSAKPDCFVLLAKPDFGVSTPLAYKAFDEKKTASEKMSMRLAKAIESGEDFTPYLSNDLEAALDLGDIKAVKERINGLGAAASLMTGSGSCVFGIFESLDCCAAAKEALAPEYGFVEVCKTI